jgi:hypothetical protein
MVTLFTIFYMINIPAIAGGWLADTFVRPMSPATATQMDSAHKSMGIPVDRSVADSLNAVIPGAGQSLDNFSASKTCITPRGQCELGTATLTGAACYCEFSSDKIFGRIQ